MSLSTYQEPSQERKRSTEPWLQGITKEIRYKETANKGSKHQVGNIIKKKLKVKKEVDSGRRSNLNHRESELYSALSLRQQRISFSCR